MRSGVTPKGGTTLTEVALAMRERSLSGSGWKERMLYNYRRGMQSIFLSEAGTSGSGFSEFEKGN